VPQVDPLTGEPKMVNDTDEAGNLKVGTGGAQTVWGVDLEAKVVNTTIIQVTPYSDLNHLAGAGSGWHLGTLVTLTMPIGFELSIPIRLEYRRFQNNYVPAYFSTFYEIERYAYPTGAEPIGPKAAVVRAAASGKDAFTFDNRSMLIAEARYEVITYVYVVGRFTRRWALDTVETSKTYNEYIGKNAWNFGVELAITF